VTVIKAAGLASFERSPDTKVRAILIYGPDSGGVRERAASLVKSIAGSLDDAFNVARLEDDALDCDPGLLADEAQSLSLMGGTKAVWIREAGSGFLKAVAPILKEDSPGNLIVAEAGGLAKNHKLRMLFETAKNALVLACYADERESLETIIASSLRSHKISISDEALALLVTLLGSDRLSSRGEIEKLLLYAHGRAQITREDVLAVCDDTAALSLDDIIDDMLEGNLASADQGFERWLESGSSATMFLGAVGRHVARLQRFRAECDLGKSADAVIRSAKPPVFYARVSRLVRQIQNLSASDLAQIATTIQAAQRGTRELPQLESELSSRMVLSLARKAMQMRRSR
jgi:DNA polymerase-3 subunit delta